MPAKLRHLMVNEVVTHYKVCWWYSTRHQPMTAKWRDLMVSEVVTHHQVRWTVIQALGAHFGEVAVSSHQKLRTHRRLAVCEVYGHALAVLFVVAHLKHTAQTDICHLNQSLV